MGERNLALYVAIGSMLGLLVAVMLGAMIESLVLVVILGVLIGAGTGAYVATVAINLGDTGEDSERNRRTRDKE